MTPFDLKIITPEKTFFEGNTEQIIVRTVSGDIGILAGHAPYVARAEKAKAAAENKLRENASQKEFERAEQKLRRAMNRLVVAGKK